MKAYPDTNGILSAALEARENSSFTPLGLISFLLLPTAYAVGCILAPLRGYRFSFMGGDWKPALWTVIPTAAQLTAVLGQRFV